MHKVKAALFVQIGEGRRRFRIVHQEIDLFTDPFADFLKLDDLLDIPPDPRSERFDLFTRKQKPSESLEQYWCALSDTGKKCEFGALEHEFVRDVSIANINNKEVKRNLSTKGKTPSEMLQYIKF